MMAKIAVLIGNGFEDVEYTRPAEAYQKDGHELIHVGLKAGETVQGKKQGAEVRIDRAVSQIRSVDEFDALLIPGGHSPDHLRADGHAVRFVRDFVKSGKPVFAICHGPQLLISAQVAQGYKMTGWKSIVQDIRNAGAEYHNEEVVEDRNLITSRGPEDIPAFIEASLGRLHATVH